MIVVNIIIKKVIIILHLKCSLSNCKMWIHTLFLSTAVSSLPLRNFVNSACIPSVCPTALCYPEVLFWGGRWDQWNLILCRKNIFPFKLPVFCTYCLLQVSWLRSFSLFPNWDTSVAMCCNAWNLFYWPDLILDLFSPLVFCKCKWCMNWNPLKLEQGR